jgi:hypothetical protein
MSAATTGTASSSSHTSNASNSFDDLHHHQEPFMEVSDSLCYSISTATNPAAIAPHNDSTSSAPKRMQLQLQDKSKDRSLLSFMNQADEAFHRLMHNDNENKIITHSNTTMMIPSSRTFEYDYDDDYNDGSADPYAEEPVPAVHNDRTVPFTLTTAVADGVSFLDMSVWSVDPYGMSVFGKGCAGDQWSHDNDPNQNEQCRPATDIHPLERPDEEDNDEEDDEYDDEYEDNDDCSATTAIPRALRVRPTVTYEVSVLTMDPALYSNSPYVEC